MKLTLSETPKTGFLVTGAHISSAIARLRKVYFKNIINVLNFLTLFFFCSQKEMMVYKAGSHKVFLRIPNWPDPDQAASSEAV